MTTNEALRAAVGARADGPTATVAGVRLAYDDTGHGPALVCLHAIGHGAGDFAGLAARFADRYRVLALDWPGQGRSQPDAVPPSVARYTELLGGWLDGLGIERAVLIGNSIGGAVAVRYAASQPRRVRGLVVENAGGFDRVDRLARTVTGGMARFFAAGSRRAGWFPFAFAAYYRMVLPCRPATAQRARIVASAYEIAPLLRDAWRSFGAPAADQRELAARIECPVLVAWAVRDRMLQLRRNLPGLRRMPRMELQRFRAGHAPHLETPEEFEAALGKFLASLGTEAEAEAMETSRLGGVGAV